MNKWVIYGSYGYTGNLIAELAASAGDPDVILSGRNKEKLRKQSERLELENMPADLDSPDELDKLLKGVDVVLHCAGPFTHTWRAMAEACLRNKCHYLDITGEIEVFEALKGLGNEFEKNSLMAMPGVGFDVVPSDCLAALLHQKMPDATHLELAISGLGGGLSRGTAKTMIENLGEGGAVRRGGRIEKVPAAHLTRKVRFGDKWRDVVSIPWGDISTAYTSTGIGNIVVYAAVPPKNIKKMKWLNRLGPIVRNDKIKSYLKSKIEKKKPGPDVRERRGGRSMLWGQVSNSKAESVTALLKTKEGYQLTAETAYKIANNCREGKFKTGFQTPSAVYGADFILQFEQSEISYL